MLTRKSHKEWDKSSLLWSDGALLHAFPLLLHTPFWLLSAKSVTKEARQSSNDKPTGCDSACSTMKNSRDWIYVVERRKGTAEKFESWTVQDHFWIGNNVTKKLFEGGRGMLECYMSPCPWIRFTVRKMCFWNIKQRCFFQRASWLEPFCSIYFNVYSQTVRIFSFTRVEMP